MASRTSTATSLRPDVLIEAGAWPPAARLRALVDRVLAAAVGALRPALAPDAELSVVFTDDVHVRSLNRRHRSKDSATNVLSFPGARADPRLIGPLVGDIVVAAETIAAEAAADGLAFEDRLTHLLVHGFLHLLGYDHGSDGEAAVMEGLETAILARLGIADPYAADSARQSARQSG